MHRSMDVLVLGGTGFLGPHVVNAAVAAGHRVTIFNRGTHGGGAPDDVTVLVGDRQRNDLRAIRGRHFDAVIDVPTMRPAWVTDLAAAIGEVGRYVFVSTISVYDLGGQPTVTESTPRQGFDGDPLTVTDEEFTANLGELYGPLKAAAEDLALDHFGDRATIVRPGLIAGPGDPTFRFTYWADRFARGGEILAPGDGEDPVQLIDVRDLAGWIVRLAGQDSGGTFNAVGPAVATTMAGMIGTLDTSIHGDVPGAPTWVPTEFLAEQGVSPWSDLPAWLPRAEPVAALARVDPSRSIAAGLTLRPLAQTAADTLSWFSSLGTTVREAMRSRAGLAADRETAVLDGWRRSGGTGTGGAR